MKRKRRRKKWPKRGQTKPGSEIKRNTSAQEPETVGGGSKTEEPKESKGRRGKRKREEKETRNKRTVNKNNDLGKQQGNS